MLKILRCGAAAAPAAGSPADFAASRTPLFQIESVVFSLVKHGVTHPPIWFMVRSVSLGRSVR